MKLTVLGAIALTALTVSAIDIARDPSNLGLESNPTITIKSSTPSDTSTLIPGRGGSVTYNLLVDFGDDVVTNIPISSSKFPDTTLTHSYAQPGGYFIVSTFTKTVINSAGVSTTKSDRIEVPTIVGTASAFNPISGAGIALLDENSAIRNDLESLPNGNAFFRAYLSKGIVTDAQWDIKNVEGSTVKAGSGIEYSASALSPGLYVVSANISGLNTAGQPISGTAKKSFGVSQNDIAAPGTPTDNRLIAYKASGKFAFGTSTKRDTIKTEFKVKLPIGSSLSSSGLENIYFSIGNIAEQFALDEKGKLLPGPVLIRKVQAKALSGSDAGYTMFSITVEGSGLPAMGLSVDGLNATKRALEGLILNRYLQINLFVGNSAYFDIVNVDYKISANGAGGSFKEKKAFKERR